MCSEWGIQNLSRSFTFTYAVSYFDVLKTSLCDKTTLKIMEFSDMQAKFFDFCFELLQCWTMFFDKLLLFLVLFP